MIDICDDYLCVEEQNLGAVQPSLIFIKAKLYVFSVGTSKMLIFTSILYLEKYFIELCTLHVLFRWHAKNIKKMSSFLINRP